VVEVRESSIVVEVRESSSIVTEVVDDPAVVTEVEDDALVTFDESFAVVGVETLALVWVWPLTSKAAAAVDAPRSA
jgi:hypothetical protein